VICVNWEDAKAYVNWLSKKAGKSYRLLSEAEWEYATRAGTTTPFWWGSSISTSQANYNGNYTYGSGSIGENHQKTLPVDTFPPNPWGLYQVHGNVWEWVEDCYHESYSNIPDATKPYQWPDKLGFLPFTPSVGGAIAPGVSANSARTPRKADSFRFCG
jgi:formylglycine-generating enzyme required for sulfatase activity